MMEISREKELFSKALSGIREYIKRKKKSSNEHSIFCTYGVINMMHREYVVEKSKGYVTKKSIKSYEEYIRLLEENIDHDKKKKAEAIQAIDEAKEYLHLVTVGRIRGVGHE